GGWALLMQDGKPQFAYALSNQSEDKYRVASDQTLPPRNHVGRFSFKYDEGGIGKGGTGAFFGDGNQGARGVIPPKMAIQFSPVETLDIGEDTGTPVVEDYVDKMPFRFTGTLKRCVVILEPQKLTEEERKRLREAEGKARMAVQ